MQRGAVGRSVQSTTDAQPEGIRVSCDIYLKEQKGTMETGQMFYMKLVKAVK